MEFVTLFCAFIATCILVRKVVALASTDSKRLSKKSLEKFSKLPSLPLVGPIYHLFKYREDIPSLLAEWRKVYGSCWRSRVFGRDVLCVQDPEILKSLQSSNEIGHLEKEPHAYQTFVIGGLKNGLLTMPAEKWNHHRKAFNPLFTYEALKNYIGMYQNHAEQLVQRIIPKQDDESSLRKESYSSLVNVTILNISTEIAVGKSFESVHGLEETIQCCEGLKTYMDISGDRVFKQPWTLSPILWYFHPLKRKVDKYLEGLHKALSAIAKTHSARADSKFALDVMMNSGWSNAEILADLGILIIAGHEAVSCVFSMVLWMLAIEQEHQAACQQEVDALFDTLDKSGQDLTVGCLSELKYLERCIKESLRLFPSSIATTRELKTPLKLKEDMVLEAGTIWTYSPYILHRDPQIFPDPEKFDPDRFLPDNVRSRHPFAYQPFSAGARNCIGWKAALMEMTVLSSVLLRHFRIRTTDSRNDIPIKFTLTVVTARKPNLIFERRNLDIKL